MSTDFSIDYAVIVVNYGDPALISANAGRIDEVDEGCLIVVVDNFHSDSARARTQELCRQRDWLFVPSPNDGYGAGVNRGVEAARALGHRTFISLNPDASASASVLRELARHVLDHPRSLVSPSMESSDGHPHFQGSMVSMRTGQMRSGWTPGDQDPEWKNWLSGACLAFSSEAFDALSGFSEEYFMYWEDVDISRRAAALGLSLHLRSDLVVVHDEGGTQGPRNSRVKSPLYYRLNIRNRMLFGRRFLRGRDWARWISASPRQSLLIWMRGGRRQALTEPRGVAAALQGLVQGASFALRRRPIGVELAGRPSRGLRASASPSPTTPFSPETAHTPKVTVAVPSFRRPAQLRALLAALPERIAETQNAHIDVLVVDNDPAGSARAATVGTGLDLRYVREETPGIAAVRNRVLDECRGSDLIAFIDDDEIPRPEWLSSLLSVWREHGSTAVMGQVVSVFDEDADPWVLASGTFYRPGRPTGTRLQVAASGNLLLDMHQVRSLGVRFDESLGLGAGEDTLFSRELVARGGTIVWCNESETEDPVVAHRVTRAWATQRAFSLANAQGQVALRLTTSRSRNLALRCTFLAGGAARILVGYARHRYGRWRRRITDDARGARTWHRGRGMFASGLGHHFQEYSRTHGATYDTAA